MRRQSGAVCGGRRRIRRGVVRAEVLAAIRATTAAAGTGRTTGASGHRLGAPEALGQPGVAAHELPVFLPHLLVLNAMEHKDKQPLQAIQYGEDVRHRYGFLVQVEKAEGPGESQQKDKDDRSSQPCPIDN